MCVCCSFRLVSVQFKKGCKTLIIKHLQPFEVEVRGFEPLASCMPCKRSSQLSYTPGAISTEVAANIKVG